MFKRMSQLLLAVAVGVTLAVAAAPSQARADDGDLYTTPGDHFVNGRWWHTDCEMYSSNVVRCSTDIWATTIVEHEGRYYNHNAWVFNNLTYLPSDRAVWAGNPLAADGTPGGTAEWTATDGRRWRTECDTAGTGSDACRAYTWSTYLISAGGSVKQDSGWVFNNIVLHSSDNIPAQSSIPAAAPALSGVPVDTPFTPPANPNPVQRCKASYYWQGQMTASGERFNPNALTAAHKTFRMNTRVKVTNPANGRSVVVRINDRGPYISGRCLDLSRAAMQAIGGTSAGVITVDYQVVG